MFGPVRDGESAHFNISGESGPFLKSKKAAAGKVSGDQAIDQAFVHFDGALEFDFCASLDAETFADHRAGDFGVAAQDEVASTFDVSGEVSFDSEVMALDRISKNDTFFVNVNVSSRLNTAIMLLLDITILHGDEASAAPTLG